MSDDAQSGATRVAWDFVAPKTDVPLTIGKLKVTVQFAGRNGDLVVELPVDITVEPRSQKRETKPNEAAGRTTGHLEHIAHPTKMLKKDGGTEASRTVGSKGKPSAPGPRKRSTPTGPDNPKHKGVAVNGTGKPGGTNSANPKNGAGSRSPGDSRNGAGANKDHKTGEEGPENTKEVRS